MDIDSSFTSPNGLAGGFPPNPVLPPQPSLVGLIVPGAPVRTDFVPVDATGTKLTIKLTSPGDLPSPLSVVNELCFFLLPGATLPPGTGILVYWQLEIVGENEQSGFELLGSLTPPMRSSDIFRTGWSEHEYFLRVGPNQRAVVNIGISIEPLETVRNLLPNGESQPSLSSAATSRRPFVAQKIALDLFNFMQSFDTNGATGNQTMVVPANIFDRWWNRFEAKLKRDPNFFLKNAI